VISFRQISCNNVNYGTQMMLNNRIMPVNAKGSGNYEPSTITSQHNHNNNNS